MRTCVSGGRRLRSAPAPPTRGCGEQRTQWVSPGRGPPSARSTDLCGRPGAGGSVFYTSSPGISHAVGS